MRISGMKPVLRPMSIRIDSFGATALEQLAQAQGRTVQEVHKDAKGRTLNVKVRR